MLRFQVFGSQRNMRKEKVGSAQISGRVCVYEIFIIINDLFYI